MPVVLAVPDDATYDYVPLSGDMVQIGTDLLAASTVRGLVITSIPPSDPGSEETWVWAVIPRALTEEEIEDPPETPDEPLSVGFVSFPETPSLQPDEWWLRKAIWRREDKPADGATMTAADGSEWIYPAGEDGRMICHAAGTEFARGDRRFRGQLATDPRDMWVCDDPDWDWMPVADGSEVVVGDPLVPGDMVTFLSCTQGVVDDLVQTESDWGRWRDFLAAGGSRIGYWVEQVNDGYFDLLNETSFFARLAKPAADETFSAPDGSRWIYVGSSHYYCWGRGTTYGPGALFLRGEIAGGLTSIT